MKKSNSMYFHQYSSLDNTLNAFIFWHLIDCYLEEKGQGMLRVSLDNLLRTNSLMMATLKEDHQGLGCLLFVAKYCYNLWN